jgi:AI-2 transport protein TqsA
MAGDNSIRIFAVLSTAILITATLYFGSAIFAPVAMSLFVMAIVWPLQKTIEARIPRVLALLLTLVATVAVIGALAWMTAWGVGMVGRWLIANIGRFYSLYAQTTEWLDGHGILLAGQFAERFNVLSLVRVFQDVVSRINGLVGFSVMVLIFTMLGLLEVRDFQKKIRAMNIALNGDRTLETITRISQKFRKYLLVRTLASILTGIVVWGFTFALGIELAAAWGVIAFALNYIPVIGPLFATVLPTLFTAAQFESWQMAVFVFLGLNVIQFVIGSYLEPRFSGSALAISPFLIVFAVFFWTFLWGIPGAFIGVPVTMAILTVCELRPSSHWIATLLSGPGRDGA